MTEQPRISMDAAEFRAFLQVHGSVNRNGDIFPTPPVEHLQDENGGYIVPEAIAGQLTQAAFRDGLQVMEGRLQGLEDRYLLHRDAASRAFLPDEQDLIVNITEHLFWTVRPLRLPPPNDRLYDLQQHITAIANTLGVDMRPVSNLSQRLRR